jgi:acetolactate synthase-1/2/3 large subunit
LAELGSARDCNADVVFVVWNNSGYLEIETSMVSAEITPIGVKPSAPDFCAIAKAFGLPSRLVSDPAGLSAALSALPRPCVIEYRDTVRD